MKKYVIFIIFIFFILISSVSASEINSTSSNVNLVDNSDESIQSTNDLDYLSTNSYSMSENELSSQFTNESLKTSSNVVNSGFEDDLDDGWTVDANQGSVSRDSAVVNDGSYSLYIVGNAAGAPTVSQSIDFTNIESISFYYYAPMNMPTTMGGILNVYILDEGTAPGTNNYVKQFAAMGNPTLTNSWQYSGEIDTTSYTGNLNLVFMVPNGNIYLDSINYVTKEEEVYEVTGYVNAPVYFNYTTAEEVTRWFWNFGDGKSSIDSNPIHVYNKTGKYDANLTIDIVGDDSKTLKYSVEIIENLVADFEYVVTGNTITILDKSSGSIKNWIFNWGNGDTTNVTELNILPSGDNIAYNYPSNLFGSFDVTLTVIDKLGKESSKTETITFYKTAPYVINVDNFEKSADGWILSDNIEFTDDKYFDGKYGLFLPVDSTMEKEINLDNIDFISFKICEPEHQQYRCYWSLDDGNLNGMIGRTGEGGDRWITATIDTSNIYGIHKLKITNGNYKAYIDTFSLNTYSTYLANFTHAITSINGDNITVKFTDNSYGIYNGLLWTFDGKNTSSLQNPTFIFNKGTHTISLFIYRDGIKMSSITKVLSLDLPTIAGTSYATIQDAIDAANTNDVINIPNIGYNFNENLIINKSLTLNFNAVVLTPKDSNVPLFNVTDGATVTVTNIGLNKKSILVTDSDSKLIIKDSDINVDLDLSEGNIDLVDDSFNGSVLTLVANTNIANSTVNSGGVIVNGGKSKIYNSTLTGCDVVVSQTAGELEIISNILTGNGVAVNVTGGKTNIAYNLIYNNAKFGLVYVGDDVVFNDNWWATSNDPSRANGENLSTDYFDVYRLEDAGVDEFSYLTLKFTSDVSVMGTNKEYSVTVMLTNDGNEIEGYIKTVDLSVNDEYLVTLENNQGTFTIKTLDTQSENTILTVLNQEYTLDIPVLAETDVIVSVDGECIVGGSVVVNVEVPYATGSVTFYVNGKATTVELNEENIAKHTIDNLAAGNYSIVVVYNGDDVFGSIVNTTSFNVEPSENLTALLEEAIANATELSNNLTEANKKIDDLTTQLNETQANVAALAGNLSDAKQEIANLTEKLTDANKKVDDLSSQLAEAQGKVLVGSVISAADLNLQAGNAGNIQVTLKDANNNLLANKNVSVIINGVTYKGLTNNNGVASISVKFASAGTYNAVVSFMGDETLKSSIGTSKVIVSKKATTLTAKKATLKVKKAKKIKVTLKSAGKAVAGKTVTIKVNKKTFKAKTNKKGVATIKVKVAKNGKFKAVVKFAGDNTYKGVSKKVKLTVKK